MTDPTSEPQASQTPLIELLRAIHPDARYEWSPAELEYRSSPVGTLAHLAADHIEQLETVIGEAYQVISGLADAAGLFGHPDVQRALDYFSLPTAQLADPNLELSILPFALVPHPSDNPTHVGEAHRPSFDAGYAEGFEDGAFGLDHRPGEAWTEHLVFLKSLDDMPRSPE